MRPKKYFITTDTHWFHDNIKQYCGRPDDFHDQLIKNLRYYLTDRDILIHLGDVVFSKHKTCLINILNSIPSIKILIRGNHDKNTNNWYLNNGFHFVCDMFTISKFGFSHKPIPPIPNTIKQYHGHWHNNDPKLCVESKYPWYDPNYHQLLMVEHHYKPWELTPNGVKLC